MRTAVTVRADNTHASTTYDLRGPAHVCNSPYMSAKGRVNFNESKDARMLYLQCTKGHVRLILSLDVAFSSGNRQTGDVYSVACTGYWEIADIAALQPGDYKVDLTDTRANDTVRAVVTVHSHGPATDVRLPRPLTLAEWADQVLLVGIQGEGLVVSEEDEAHILRMAAHPAETLERYGLSDLVTKSVFHPYLRSMVLSDLVSPTKTNGCPRMKAPAWGQLLYPDVNGLRALVDEHFLEQAIYSGLAIEGVDESTFARDPFAYPAVYAHALAWFPLAIYYLGDRSPIRGMPTDAFTHPAKYVLTGMSAGDCEDGSIFMMDLSNRLFNAYHAHVRRGEDIGLRVSKLIRALLILAGHYTACGHDCVTRKGNQKEGRRSSPEALHSLMRDPYDNAEKFEGLALHQFVVLYPLKTLHQQLSRRDVPHAENNRTMVQWLERELGQLEDNRDMPVLYVETTERNHPDPARRDNVTVQAMSACGDRDSWRFFHDGLHSIDDFYVWLLRGYSPLMYAVSGQPCFMPATRRHDGSWVAGRRVLALNIAATIFKDTAICMQTPPPMEEVRTVARSWNTRPQPRRLHGPREANPVRVPRVIPGRETLIMALDSSDELVRALMQAGVDVDDPVRVVVTASPKNPDVYHYVDVVRVRAGIAEIAADE